MGFFTTYKPRITKEEFQKAINYIQGLSQKERDFVREFFEGSLDLDSPREEERGIDSAEMDALMSSLRESAKMHNLSEEKLQNIEKTMRRYI